MHPAQRPNHAYNRLLAALSPLEQRRLAPFIEDVTLSAKTVLCSSGKRFGFVVFPYDAVVSTLAELPDGEMIEVGLVGSEGAIGLALLAGSDRATTTVIVQVPGHGGRMRADDFRREVVQRGGESFRLLLRYGDVFLAMVTHAAGCNISHGLEQRCARWLLTVHDRAGRDSFPVTHEFLAMMLGVRRASVSIVAQGLRTAGAIDYEHGVVDVRSRAELERRSCGCYALLRELADSLVLPLSNAEAK